MTPSWRTWTTSSLSCNDLHRLELWLITKKRFWRSWGACPRAINCSRTPCVWIRTWRYIWSPFSFKRRQCHHQCPLNPQLLYFLVREFNAIQIERTLGLAPHGINQIKNHNMLEDNVVSNTTRKEITLWSILREKAVALTTTTKTISVDVFKAADKPKVKTNKKACGWQDPPLIEYFYLLNVVQY